MQTPEGFAWEVLASDDFVLTPHEVLTDLIRARDAEVAEQVRAETLAGFVEEWKDRRDCGCRVPVNAIWSCCFGVGRTVATERRLIGPWQPVEP